MVQLFYTTYTSVNLAHHEIVRAKVGMGGIMRQIDLCKILCLVLAYKYF